MHRQKMPMVVAVRLHVRGRDKNRQRCAEQQPHNYHTLIPLDMRPLPGMGQLLLDKISSDCLKTPLTRLSCLTRMLIVRVQGSRRRSL
jgi:hypothetical protein